MRGSGIYWLCQIVGWTAYCSLITISLVVKDPNQVNVEFVYSISSLLLVGLTVTHLQRAVFVRNGWLDMKLSSLIPRLIISSLISAALLTLLLTLFDSFYLGSKAFDEVFNDPEKFVINIIAVWIVVLFWIAIYFTYHYFQKSRHQEVANLELKATNKESELKNLRSQLNPHFLFNSLNSIRALVDIEPAKAKVAITTLSNLLRQSLVIGKEDLVTVEAEVNVARNYLDLERIRFEERLQVEWELDENIQFFMIPPFTLQMMVENAIKHGISNLKEGGIVKIKVFKEDGHVVLLVTNTGTLKTVSDLGVGIQNIQKRLDLQFGEDAKFLIREINENVEAKIIFRYEGI